LNGVNGNLVGNTNPQDNTNSLGTWKNNALYNQRWVNVTLSVSDASGGCAGMTSVPAANTFAWKFDYTIAGTNYAAGTNFITMTPVAGVTYTDATSIGSTIAVAAGTTSITLPLQSYIRWGVTNSDQDQDFVFTVVSNTTVLDDDAVLDYTDGKEPVANNGDNASASQHIDASPATPRITINY
jgi:hypothetical protein